MMYLLPFVLHILSHASLLVIGVVVKSLLCDKVLRPYFFLFSPLCYFISFVLFFFFFFWRQHHLAYPTWDAWAASAQLMSLLLLDEIFLTLIFFPNCFFCCCDYYERSFSPINLQRMQRCINMPTQFDNPYSLFRGTLSGPSPYTKLVCLGWYTQHRCFLYTCDILTQLFPNTENQSYQEEWYVILYSFGSQVVVCVQRLVTNSYLFSPHRR